MLDIILLLTMTWWFIIPASFLTVWFMHIDADWWALGLMLILGTVLYHFLQVPPKILGYIVMGYIPAGIVWSVYRWKRYCKEVFKTYYSKDMNKYDKARLQTRLQPKAQMTKILTWVFLFPLSFIESFIGDLIDTVETIIRKYLIAVYENIANKYTNQLK